MSSDKNTVTPSAKLGLAVAAGVILIGGSFAAAWHTQQSLSLFSLSPVVADGVAIPPLDVISTQKIYAFHVTIYTIWATMLLCLPAFCTVWFVRNSRVAGEYWLAFWTVGLVAMLVHLYMAMGVLFEWNWRHILEDTVRVTIPKPDLILTAWWVIDVMLGWCFLHSKRILIHTQRVLLHAALLIIFLIGFIREGEILMSKIIGAASGLTVLAAIVFGLVFYRARSVTCEARS